MPESDDDVRPEGDGGLRPPRLSGAVFSGGADVIAAGLGMLVAGPVGMFAAIVPSVLQFALEGTQYLLAKRSIARLAVTTAEELNTDEQGLADSIRDAGPEGLPLALEVLQAAGRATEEAKIDALARVWARGLVPSADLREDLLMVRVLAQLEPAHVGLMKLLAEGPAPWEQIQVRLPELERLLPLLIGSLHQLGLAEEQLFEEDPEHKGLYPLPGPYGTYRLTEWGRAALRDLEGRTRPDG